MVDSRNPFAPGESPFRVRGSTYLGMREYVLAHVPGGFDAVGARLPDDAHRAFATQVFLPVAWYDALVIPVIADAIAEVEGISMADSVRRRAVLVAQRDLSGLYKVLLKVVSPELVIERLQRAGLRYFDFGRVDVGPTSRGRAEGTFHGVPAPFIRWFGPMLSGYASTVLEAAGATTPRVRVDPAMREGESRGVELAAVRFHFSWS